MQINACIKHYVSGIIDDREGACDCSTRAGPNHAVALVGFGVDPTISYEDVRKGRCREYWLLRNSWTENWGEKGYFRLCRNDENLRDGTCFVRHDGILPYMFGEGGRLI
mmetsp:Transcript_11871/g.20082  ORF Transcript_11871/g.20082 Transcript_11871/m.20082 type:complete len:109 (-) Transcript_11871:62-388(-)